MIKKISIISLLSIIISISVGVGISKQEMNEVRADINTITEDINSLDNRTDKHDINFATQQEVLRNIAATLKEIKKDVKQLLRDK